MKYMLTPKIIIAQFSPNLTESRFPFEITQSESGRARGRAELNALEILRGRMYPFKTMLKIMALAGAITAALLAVFATPADAQSTNYSSVEVSGTTPLQLSYHASAHKNCTPAPLPTVRVIRVPTSGTLTVRRATLTTDKVANCPRLQIPAQVVFYTARAGYSGPDHVIYEVTDSNDEVSTYDVTIKVNDVHQPAEIPKSSNL
jgi:hypothetical protein